MSKYEDLDRLARLLDEGKVTQEEFERAKKDLFKEEPQPSAREPGWYNDPSGSKAHQAYWDGDRWTGATRSAPTPAPPAPIGQANSGLSEPIKMIGGVITLILVLGFCANYFLGESPISPGINFPNSSCTKSITYEVTGTAKSVSLTLQNSGGNTEQFASESVPWSETAIFDCGEFAYLSAQNNGASGSVGCSIKAGASVIETAESSGAYVIASCSGTVPR